MDCNGIEQAYTWTRLTDTDRYRTYKIVSTSIVSLSVFPYSSTSHPCIPLLTYLPLYSPRLDIIEQSDMAGDAPRSGGASSGVRRGQLETRAFRMGPAAIPILTAAQEQAQIEAQAGKDATNSEKHRIAHMKLKDDLQLGWWVHCSFVHPTHPNSKGTNRNAFTTKARRTWTRSLPLPHRGMTTQKS